MWKACFPFVLRWFMAMFSRWESWLLAYGVMLGASTSEVLKTLEDLILEQWQDSRHTWHGFLCELRLFTGWHDGCLWILLSSICVSGYALWVWELRPLVTVCVPSPHLGSVGWLNNHCIPSFQELRLRKRAAVSSCLFILQALSVLVEHWWLVTCCFLLELSLISLTASIPVVWLSFRAPSLFLSWAHFWVRASEERC